MVIDRVGMAEIFWGFCSRSGAHRGQEYGSTGWKDYARHTATVVY